MWLLMTFKYIYGENNHKKKEKKKKEKKNPKTSKNKLSDTYVKLYEMSQVHL